MFYEVDEILTNLDKVDRILKGESGDKYIISFEGSVGFGRYNKKVLEYNTEEERDKQFILIRSLCLGNK